MVEVGVYRGEFASRVLKRCDSLEKYYMIDPWRHLDNWNKPANLTDNIFEQFLSETKSKTDFAEDKRIILRGKTTEVIEEVADGELDFAYIDGDHTLKGITIDLIRVYNKIRDGGCIGGDDFCKTVWQHGTEFEPTLVFPFALYFAEAIGTRVYSLPYNQFLIEKTRPQNFSFVDLAGGYNDTTFTKQFRPDKVFKLWLAQAFPSSAKFIKILRRFIAKNENL